MRNGEKLEMESGIRWLTCDKRNIYRARTMTNRISQSFVGLWVGHLSEKGNERVVDINSLKKQPVNNFE